MKRIISTVSISISLALLAAMPMAIEAATAQQEKMAACSKENKGLKGEEYKQARKECLSRGSAPVKAAVAGESPARSQKNKMAACSKENKGLKGEEFKAAQKECLSK